MFVIIYAIKSLKYYIIIVILSVLERLGLNFENQNRRMGIISLLNITVYSSQYHVLWVCKCLMWLDKKDVGYDLNIPLFLY